MTTGYEYARREKTAQLRSEVYGETAPGVITLPWPPKELSPNARVHWAVKNKKAKAYKEACWFILRSWRDDLKGASKFAINFRAPDARRRDTDNLIASLKFGIDTMAMVAKVDDSLFEITYSRKGVTKGGAVEIVVLG